MTGTASPAAAARDPRWVRWFPFLAWFPVSAVVLRGDVIAGITGALVLVPKAMAYAQLSGLPVHFGLYVAFVPAILGALWGSSRQLATGPVAIISLMTAAALTPLAVPFSEHYIELALLLTLMVGLIQFALGVLKLGTIVNFVSHPVILGFMNAAAIIIALSQLDLLLGIPKGRSDWFLADVWGMLLQLPQTSLPTLAMSLFALALMLGLKRVKPLARLSVLIAVAATIVVSHLIGYQRIAEADVAQIRDDDTRALVLAHGETERAMGVLNAEIAELTARLRELRRRDVRTAATLRHQLHLAELDVDGMAAANKRLLRDLQQLRFERTEDGTLYLRDRLPEGTASDGRTWRLRKLAAGTATFAAGGEVVGSIPGGLPALRVPTITLDALLSLLSAAVVIALVGFMESIAMAKAMAATTRQRIDPNQELIGQGVANLGGSFFQSYPACGSFTGSAINLAAGATTGLAMVFNGLFVVATLLLLTPLLYALPKAALGVIILLAVTTLLTPKALLQTWRASRADGAVAGTTFVVTLLMAPHLDKGILIGAALAVVLYLYRTMKPRVAELGRHPDGTLRDVKVHPDLPTSRNVIALRFDDSLYFANAAHFEQAVLDALAAKPDAKYVLIVANGINQIDATGEEIVRHLVERLRAIGVGVVFCGLKKQLRDVMQRTGLDRLIGDDHVFPDEQRALAAIYQRLGGDGHGELLPRSGGAA
ncbi:MAG: SulP family inorganic anion transporter [Rubrivivax sp.]|nr:SulP family inorganic anion transporter [Rubrivivax sp.]